MGMKLVTWDEAQTKEEIVKRYRHASDARRGHEERWVRNERVIYSTASTLNMSMMQTSLEANFNIGLPGVDSSNAEMNVAYAFKNFRFLHAQMSANPPSVVMRPTTSDQEDHRKADAADRVVRWAIRHYNMQEQTDQATLQALLYGTGLLKVVWDSTKGAILDFDQETGEMKLEGDLSITSPFMWNIYLDPDAKSIAEVKHIIERIYMDYDEACLRWPDKKELLKKAKIERRDGPRIPGRDTMLNNERYNSVELLEYWETGLPSNGYMGKFCITTTEGDVIEPCRPNPCRFKQAGAVAKIEAMDGPTDEEKERMIARLPEQAQLPYPMLTDIDIPNTVWGRSIVEYGAQLQENLNKVDSAVLDNIQAHGVARMVVPESADLPDDGLSNSPWDVTKISGNQPPYFMGVPQLMPEMSQTRNNIIQGINDVFGINESMMGNQSREQAAAAMQYATNQGNMIRRRLFNKYVLFVEQVYKLILNNVAKHWTITRSISVLGKEKALEAIDLKGADIDGGYDIVGEYGVSLSLDPMTRRQEIITMQPLFKEAGIPTRTILKFMKLNELDSMYDELGLADSRQKEIFDAMISSGSYIPPKKYRDHENMIAFAMKYFMTQEFESLPENIQALCERHIEERAQLAATEKPTGPAAQAPGPGPGPVPEGGPEGAVPAPTGLPPIQPG